MNNNFDISCIIEPVEKRGGLFQGSIITATNINALNQYNISCVLSVCSEFKIQYGQEINNLILDCHDFPTADITTLFDQAHNYLEQSRQYSNVLVHCHAGKSRSTAIVISYLMKKRNLNLEQALIYVKRQRPIASPNPGFIKQLLLYELQIQGKITSQLTDKITPYFHIQQQLQTLNSPLSTPLTTPQKQQRTSLQLLDYNNNTNNNENQQRLQQLNSPTRQIPNSSPFIHSTPQPKQINNYDQFQFTSPQIQRSFTNSNQNTFSFQQPIAIPFTVPVSNEVIPAIKKEQQQQQDLKKQKEND